MLNTMMITIKKTLDEATQFKAELELKNEYSDIKVYETKTAVLDGSTAKVNDNTTVRGHLDYFQDGVYVIIATK